MDGPLINVLSETTKKRLRNLRTRYRNYIVVGWRFEGQAKNLKFNFKSQITFLQFSCEYRNGTSGLRNVASLQKCRLQLIREVVNCVSSMFTRYNRKIFGCYM